MVFSWPYRKKGTGWNESYYHGRCFVAEFGFKALADMPEQFDKLSLGDLGVDLARRIVQLKASQAS
jgi:hypothetical protein